MKSLWAVLFLCFLLVGCGGGGGGGNSADSSNANLASLTLSSGTLDQIFQASQLSYTSTQTFPVASIRVTPTAAAAGATIAVDSTAVASGQLSQPIALAEDDETVVTIVVTATDGTTSRTYTITITRQSAGTFAQQAYIKGSNADPGDQFGYSTALSGDGNTLAVGAWAEDSSAAGIGGDQTDNSASSSGAVYVFIRSSGIWSQQAYIKASNAEAGDFFGGSVALSADGDTLAVGAPREASNATGSDGDQTDNSALASGAVYVFARSGEIWSQQAYVKASNAEANDSFGELIALSSDGNTLAVTATGESSNATGIDGDQTDNSATNSGAVYVFTLTGEGWNQQAYVKASNTGAGDQFGLRALALSGDGNTLAVGTAGESSNATGIGGDQTNDLALSSGAVYVFARSVGIWSQQAYVKASNAEANDNFGNSVALSGDGHTLAVGARGEDSNATGSDGDQTNNSVEASGAAYIFIRSEGMWSQQAYVKASNTGEGDQFGFSIDLSSDGHTLAVGAPLEDSNATGIDGDQTNNSVLNSGAVYLFTRTDGMWNQQAYVKASNTGTGDLFGYNSVALSGDGHTLAVGTYLEDSNATGIDGDQDNDLALSSGAVYVYGDL